MSEDAHSPLFKNIIISECTPCLNGQEMDGDKKLIYPDHAQRDIAGPYALKILRRPAKIGARVCHVVQLANFLQGIFGEKIRR